MIDTTTNERPTGDGPSPAERRRRQFVEIAARLIAQEGISAVGPARVASEAGCTRPLVYRYFPSVDDLLAAVADEFSDRVAAQVTEVTSLATPECVFDMCDAALHPDSVGPMGAAPLLVQIHTRALPANGARAVWRGHLMDLGLSITEVELIVESLTLVLNNLLSATRHRQDIAYDEARRIFTDICIGVSAGVLGEQRRLHLTAGLAHAVSA